MIDFRSVSRRTWSHWNGPDQSIARQLGSAIDIVNRDQFIGSEYRQTFPTVRQGVRGVWARLECELGLDLLARHGIYFQYLKFAQLRSVSLIPFKGQCTEGFPIVCKGVGRCFLRIETDGAVNVV